MTDPTGAQTQATYDNLGQLVTTTDLVRQNASAAYTTTYGYDAAGNQISQTSPTGVDHQGRLQRGRGADLQHRRGREHHHLRLQP